LALLKQVYEKLSKVPTSATKQLRILLFPETNQGSTIKYYLAGLFPGVYAWSGGKAIDVDGHCIVYIHFNTVIYSV
jgi:hypothetical protein